MSAPGAENPFHTTESSSEKNSSAVDVSDKSTHPLYSYRNIPAVIDDRIRIFVCRSVLLGDSSFRPSLLCTQVAESLGGSDAALVESRIIEHCGKGQLLRVVVRISCPTCGRANLLPIPVADIQPDATMACAHCEQSFRISGSGADESLEINQDFCEYLRASTGSWKSKRD